MSVSYPYFTVAKNYNIDYGKVLGFIDIINSKNLALDVTLEQWQMSALVAWDEERRRRLNLGVG